MDEETRNEILIDLLIGAICKRPDMYIGRGDGLFDAAVAYLLGWFGALAQCGAQIEDVNAWDGFGDWLHEKFHCPKSRSVLHRLRGTCPDDRAALERLAALWSEYRGRMDG